MADRTREGRWLPGVTGNGGGRPKTDPAIRQALEAGSLAAAERLVALTASEDERVALAASVAILDRVLGKPAQALEVAAARGPDDDGAIRQALIIDILKARHARLEAGLPDDDE